MRIQTIEFPLFGPGKEPVDLRRTINGHGVTSLPPMTVDEAANTLRVTLALPSLPARTVTIRVGRRGCGAIDVHGAPVTEGENDLILGAVRHIQCDHGFNANPEFPPHKWRLEKALAGGGSMYDIGIYGLNTSLMMLAGDRPIQVSAVYAYPRDDPRFAEVEGGIDWRLTLASGVNVMGSSSYCYSPYVSRQRYFGATASIEMQPATTYDDNNLVLDGGGQPRREIGAGNPMEQFAAQVDGFSQAARANRAHATPGEMGLRDIRLIEAMYRSADAGGAVIDL